MTPIGEPLEPDEDDRFGQCTGGEKDGPGQDHPVPARPALLIRSGHPDLPAGRQHHAADVPTNLDAPVHRPLPG